MRYSKEQLQAQYKLLPDRIKTLMGNTETVDNIMVIGKKYNFHIDQLNTLNEEVSLVLYGIERPENFQTNLRKYLGVSEDIANLITYDINQQILLPIKEDIKELYSPLSSKKSPTEQTFDQKMGGMTSVPKQTVEVKPETGDNKITAPTTPPRDPYREPI